MPGGLENPDSKRNFILQQGPERSGEEAECGWLKDRYGLSWQIVPAVLGEMMSDPDPARSQKVMEALVKMKKLDLAELEKAYGKTKAA
jgi:predicted 3-demethylubiquinone-9 3-methyltransferase (glyoxalase superfamily)